MSHVATNWLAGLPGDLTTGSEFKLLFVLCDCHNPSRGCFPTQDYLRERTALSNGSVNNALRSLELKGLVKRKRRCDGDRKKALPTLYILGFEDAPADNTPKSGDRSRPYSNPDHDHTPVSGTTILQPAGDKPVMDLERTSNCKKGKSSFSKQSFTDGWRPDSALREWAASEGFTSAEIDRQTESCVDHNLAAGNSFADLGRAWKVWMRRAKAYRRDAPDRAQSPRAGGFDGTSSIDGILARIQRREAEERAS